MKVTYDFGDIKQDEREKTTLFLNTFFPSPVIVTNNARKYDFNEEKMFFSINDTIFSISFPKKISLKEQEKFFNLLRLNLKEGLLIKKTFSYSENLPLMEEEFEYEGKKYFFACPEKQNLIKNSSLKEIKDLSTLNTNLKIKFKVNDFKKVSNNVYKLDMQEAFAEQEIFFDKKFSFLYDIEDENIVLSLKEKGEYMEEKDNINVKGEIYIGNIELDLKTLSLLAPNDKIIFNKEDAVNAILKIGENKVFEGHLDFNEEDNILFVVDKKL